MIHWFKKKHDDVTVADRLKACLQKTRQHLGQHLTRLLLGQKKLDATIAIQIEECLVMADVGLPTTRFIIERMQNTMQQQHISDATAVLTLLKQILKEILLPCQQPLLLPAPLISSYSLPYVILMVGVNGAGKTTTAAKLAQYYQQQGQRIMLAAGDTFRSAAVEQLKIWGERTAVPVVAQTIGSDSAAVIFDAFKSARSQKIDILIADTAGRLHTRNDLLDELQKVQRVLRKLEQTAPHEVMLVIDANMGQNVINQVREFHRVLGLTGITMTKLDGTAKGGILFALAHEFQLPIRFLGMGEGVDDLRPFDPQAFVEAIFDVRDGIVA